jgi:hypothetical protein
MQIVNSVPCLIFFRPIFLLLLRQHFFHSPFLVAARVARISWYKIPKTGKLYQITTNYTKRPKDITKDSKVDQVSIKYTTARPSKFYQNLDFWFENKPSGNPGGGTIFFLVCG